jgi:hypothetical protein
MTRDPKTLFGVAAQLVADLHDLDPGIPAALWAGLPEADRYAVAVILACQVDPERVTVHGMAAAVNRVAGLREAG